MTAKVQTILINANNFSLYYTKKQGCFATVLPELNNLNHVVDKRNFCRRKDSEKGQNVKKL